jgi:hypothetical protein
MAATPSGKDKLLRWARVFVGGYDISGDARTFGNFSNKVEGVDMTGVDEELINYLSDGVRQVGITGFRCLMNDNTNRSMDLLDTADALNEVSVLFGGGGEPVVADLAYFLPAAQMKTNTAWDGAAGTMEADFLFDAANYDGNSNNPAGVVLNNSQLTATKTATAHQVAASSANGWHATLHTTATSNGNYALIIEHAATESSYATLGTFSGDGSTITSEHLSGSGTVNKYVRFDATRTAGTATFICVFARN